MAQGRRKRFPMGRVRPGRGQRIGLITDRLQGGEHRRGALDVHDAGPGVAAGQLQGRMPHHLLHDPGRDTRGIGQRRRFAPQRMEVKHQSRGVAVWDVGGGQIHPKHLGASSAAGQREDGRAGRQRRHVGGQIVRQVPREGQRRRVAVLRVGGGYRDAGGLPVERPGKDGADLGEPQPGGHGEPVAESSHRPGHPDVSRAPVGDLDEPLQFIEGDGPAVVPPIFLGVEPLDPPEGMLSQPMSVVAPLGEPADRRGVVVARRQRSAFPSERRQGGLHPLRIQIG